MTMNDFSIDALADAHFASRDPQYQEEENTMRELHEELEGIYDEADDLLHSVQRMAKQYGIHRNKLVLEAQSGLDQALDALDTLKGEIESEISDF